MRIMKKHILSLLFTIVLCFAAITFVSAERAPRLVDSAGLLSVSEEETLLNVLDSVSESLEFDIVIVTVDSVGSKKVVDFADDFYDNNGYGYGSSYDGVLLLISMEERDYYISTCGYGIYAITDAGREYIEDCFVPYLSNGEYLKAFRTFVSLCEDYVVSARTDEPYDVGNMPGPEEKFPVFQNIGIALVVGFIAALITVSVMKGQLKSVRMKNSASDYVKAGGLNLTERSDIYLYRNVVKRAKPQDNDSGSHGGGSHTHVSSSGRSHGGGGGKF